MESRNSPALTSRQRLKTATKFAILTSCSYKSVSDQETRRETDLLYREDQKCWGKENRSLPRHNAINLNLEYLLLKKLLRDPTQFCSFSWNPLSNNCSSQRVFKILHSVHLLPTPPLPIQKTNNYLICGKETSIKIFSIETLKK